MTLYVVILSLLCGHLVPGTSQEASKNYDAPRLPGATLLVGSANPFFLTVTTPKEIRRILPEPNQPENRDYTAVYPSMSRDGSLVAAARLKKPGVPGRTVAIATYFMPERRWTEYAQGQFAGVVAISPDGSKLAFSTSRQEVEDKGDDHLHIVDLKTGRESIGPQVSAFSRIFASWSSDGHRLAYGFDYGIRIWDTDTGKTSKIADGVFPVWSPSGEWIAYLQGDPTEHGGSRCMEVRPDGTGETTLVQLPKERGFVEPPVWSPDSNAILLNELSDFDKGLVDVQMLDVKTLELKRVFKDVLPVLGWAAAK